MPGVNMLGVTCPSRGPRNGGLRVIIGSLVGERANYGCRYNALPAAVTNIRMTADDGASDAGWSRDALCVKFDVL